MTESKQHQPRSSNKVEFEFVKPKTPPSRKVPTSDPRTECTPTRITSQSLITTGVSEVQTHAKMAKTLVKEMQTGTVVDVPNLVETKLCDEAISRGMGRAKFGRGSSLASSFAVKVADMFEKLTTGPSKKGKYLLSEGRWRAWRTQRRVPVDVPKASSALQAQESAKLIMQQQAMQRASSSRQSQEFAKPSSRQMQDFAKPSSKQMQEMPSSSSRQSQEFKKPSSKKFQEQPTSGSHQTQGGSKPSSRQLHNLAKKPSMKLAEIAKSLALRKPEGPRKRRASEEDVADFFNRLGELIRTEYGIEETVTDARVFSARFKDRSPAQAAVNCIRKPDVVVLNRTSADATEAAWEEVRGLLEVKFSSNLVAIREAYRELLSCVRMVFSSQPGRRFVLGATVIIDVMTFYVFDRSGVLQSEEFNINEQPERFLRVVLGLLFVDEIKMGYDPTVQKNTNGYYSVLLKGVEYVCDVEPLYVESSIRGRGTSCFKTMHNGEAAVIKDAWVDDSRKKLEHEILQKVKDVEGVVKIVDHEIVQVDGKDDTTTTDRKVLIDGDRWKSNPKWKGFSLVETRTHRRFIMKPCGEPLENFASLTELLTVIKDIVKCIEDLIERKVLHRDISLRNLILARSDPKDPTSRLRGYIIDFDYAIDLENISDDVAKGARTGTLPFMALEMLVEENSNKVPHAYYHDLESVFYSLCWLCTSQEGPFNTERQKSASYDFDKSEVAKWNGVGMENPSLDDIRRCKAATIGFDAEFSDKVLDQFAPYFEPIKPCIAALREVMVNENSNVEKMNAFYRSRIDRCKQALEKARRNGEPVDPMLLKGIPNSERDYRDVFQSIFDIIDITLADLVEPPIPPRCLLPKEEKCDASPFEDNARKIKTVREVLEKKEAAAIDKVVAIEEKKRQEKEKKDKKKQKVVDKANAALRDSMWTARDPEDGRMTVSTCTDDSLDIPEGETLGSGPRRLFETGASTPSLESDSEDISLLSSAVPHSTSHTNVPCSMDSVLSKRSHDGDDETEDYYEDDIPERKRSRTFAHAARPITSHRSNYSYGESDSDRWSGSYVDVPLPPSMGSLRSRGSGSYAEAAPSLGSSRSRFGAFESGPPPSGSYSTMPSSMESVRSKRAYDETEEGVTSETRKRLRSRGD